MCCICHCLSLFWKDHNFDPPYGSNHLPVINSLYAYTEISSFEEILHTADMTSQKNITCCEDQRGLVKLVRVTRYRNTEISTFDRKPVLFSRERNEVFKTMLKGFPALSFSLRNPLVADPVRRPPAFSIVPTDREPGTA